MSLVVLIGPSGAGKSTFARAHFKPTEVLSSDFFRGLVRDDEAAQDATADAFAALHFVARKRLAAGLLTVVDATNVQPEARVPLVGLAREFHVVPVAIVFDLDVKTCVAHNDGRPGRENSFGYVRGQHGDMRRSFRGRPQAALRREGFRYVYVFESDAEASAAAFVRQPLWPDRRDDHGPFDIVGDVHGCADELRALLGKLGYGDDASGVPRHPAGRRVVFLGDLVDRGPKNVDVLRLAMRMHGAGAALCVPGNHDVKLLKWLQGTQVQRKHGLERTLAEIEALAEPEQQELRTTAAAFLDDLVSHLVLDRGRLVVAHAGMGQAMQGRASGAVRTFALYGDTTGEIDEFGLPVRYPWAEDYRGDACVVYGHTPVPTAEWLNKTICIDTGCVFGGALTALRWPEKELVSVAAHATWYEPVRPLASAAPVADRTLQQQHDDVLDVADFTGKAILTTRLLPHIVLQADERAAALEAASRFAVDPRWLIHLPPTMSPPQTTARADLLEHPDEAFGYFHAEGIAKVVCEQKHMGSRAILVVARDAASAHRRFGVVDGSASAILTRTGRPFFPERELGLAFAERVRAAVSAAGWWERLATDWVVLDAELMPWSAKAQELLRTQYAAVGAAAVGSLARAAAAVAAGAARHPELTALHDLLARHHGDAEAFVAAYRGYCWPVAGLADYRLAPFHLLAAEGRVFADATHEFHMQKAAELAAQDPGWLVATPWRTVQLADGDDCARAVAWWEELTAAGTEGMVVKPFDFVARGRRIVQPAIKCRGREYLRIIYGPNYTAPQHLERLRKRGLANKRSLAMREFALGLEALERFVRREPLRRVHECVLGVLALECEPVDPRL
ncbi:MAG: polynucleotide kinase-phosphatase [Planctomycetota bacterium]